MYLWWVMGSAHGESDRSKIGGSELVNALEAALVSSVVTERGSTDGFSGGNFYGKLEGSWIGETLGAEDGYDRGSSNCSLYGIVDDNLRISTLVQ